jgi:histidyl-tRNA synthetase
VSQSLLLQRPKGTQDILFPDIQLWQDVEKLARQWFSVAGYQEIRTPVFEPTELYVRGVGDTTDIVNKEMYSFEMGERQLTLRPEGTAGVVRAYLQNGLSRWPKPVKLFYMGPMFRYERPQAGRQRQFHQLGVEVFGLDTPAVDAEVIVMAWQFLQQFKLKDLTLEINTLGNEIDRAAFRKNLKVFLTSHLPALCSTCNQRFQKNPLRMLDCKVPTCREIYDSEPCTAFLKASMVTRPESIASFEALQSILQPLNVPFVQNYRLVRGLDYYTGTVFEISCKHLGAQNAVCGGGRYNGLVTALGGPETSAVGFGIGLERLIALLSQPEQVYPQYYIVSEASVQALALAQQLRRAGKFTLLDLSGKSRSKQLAMADKSGAAFAIILEDTPLDGPQSLVAIKNLKTGVQRSVALQELLGNYGE